MLCIKKSYFLSIFALFAVLFGSCIFTSKNVSAVSDIIYTSIYDGSSFPSIGNFCNNNESSLPNCSDYSYLIIDSSIPTTQNLYASNGLNRATSMAYTTFSIIKIPSDWSRIGFFGLSLNSASSSDFIKFTLTDNYSSCPSVEPCPEIPDNPYDPKFDEIKQAILIIPATALVIYFFFCIYRMLLKGRE